MSEADQAYPEASSLDPQQFPPDPDPQADGAPRNWPVNLDKRGFRLPTEAEWEVACRGGTSSARSFGNDSQLLGYYGWFIDNPQKWSHVAGQLRPNPRGLFDMHGNVLGWCHDLYGGAYAGEAVDPVGAQTGSGRVVRGGSWTSIAALCRSAGRVFYPPITRGGNLGFRVLAVPFNQASEAGRAASAAGGRRRQPGGCIAEPRSPAELADCHASLRQQ
jgi:hypothetical protein